MATIQRISHDALPSDGPHVLVRLGDEDGLGREGESFVYTVNRNLPANEFESRTQRTISDAQLLADQEKIDVVFVCFEP
jgi:hypothetical protein